jgi:hypothetical protein
MFRHARAIGLEGIVSKRLTSRYKSGACKSWLKVKNPAYERASQREREGDAPRANRKSCDPEHDVESADVHPGTMPPTPLTTC